MSNRIRYLDGHRGLAIAMVLLYHGYAKWADVMPVGSQLAHVVPVRYGWAGVDLFFLLSGYVILMTLERSRSVGQFLRNRWLRLFPAMLVCSLLMYLSSPWMPHRPEGQPELISLVPGLLFVDPWWLSMLTRREWPLLDGAFWTLIVEFKFYVFAALVYFWRGRVALVAALALAFLLAQGGFIVDDALGLTKHNVVTRVSAYLSSDYFGWFGSGAAFYLYQQTQRRGWFAVGVVLAVAASLFMRLGRVVDDGSWTAVIMGLVVTALFAASLVWQPLRQVLTTRVLQVLGAASYPLYLMHQNVVASLAVSLGAWLPMVPALLLPLLPMVALVGVAHVVATRVEGPIRARLTRLTGGLAQTVTRSQ